MKRVLLSLALLGLLATSLNASAGPWLQPRGDAEATGYQPEEGPEWPDVALRWNFPMPGSLSQPR